MMLRVFAALALFGVLTVQAGPAPAAEPSLRALQGHWRCSGGSHVERSYLVYRAYVKSTSSVRTDVYGRADDADGAGDIEHLSRAAENDPLVWRGPEGDGTASVDPHGTLVVSGKDAASGQPFTVTTAVDGSMLTRTSVTSSATVTERCTAEPVAPVASCTQPNRPPSVLKAAPLSWAGHYGTVAVIVTLDDRSEVLWTDVQTHLGEIEDSMAEQATRTSVYQTAVQNCRPVPGQYIFTSEWRDR